MKDVYGLVLKFKSKGTCTIGWRLKSHSKIVQKFLNEDEEVKYVFYAQKNDNPLWIFDTAVIAITNKRVIIGRKRVLFGYFLDSITPELFNDFKIRGGIIWGKVHIDTLNELIKLSNISKAALMEIEEEVTKLMISKKRNNETVQK